MSEASVRNLRVLVVEDEPLIAMLIEDALADLDCSVAAVASSRAEALDKASSLDFDVAILDINLGGASALPVAELLLREGIPFIFSTGYGAAGIPEAFPDVPLLSKPFRTDDIGRCLGTAMRRR